MPLDASLIIYNRGAGGNFIARILTLDEATVPLGSKNNLTTLERFELYDYKNIKLDYNSYGTFNKDSLSNWVDIELKEMYFPLTRGIEALLEMNLQIIEPMHPDELEEKLNYFGIDDITNLIVLDSTGQQEWVLKQKIHKGAYADIQSVEIEYETECKIIDQLSTLNCIDLAHILGTDNEFVQEYHRACDMCRVEAYDDLAIQLRNSWKETWAR
jgi:hypothetical protein